MEQFHATTIVCVRRGNRVALGGDGQVTLGNIVIKGTARKIRRLYHDKIWPASPAHAFAAGRFRATDARGGGQRTPALEHLITARKIRRCTTTRSGRLRRRTPTPSRCRSASRPSSRNTRAT